MVTPSSTSPTTLGSLSGVASTSTTAPNPNVGGSSGPPPILIAKQFIKQYYPILTLSPQHIPKFYHPTDSQLRYTTSMEDNHNGEAAVVKFVELIPRLDFARGAKMDLASGFIDAQRTLDGGVLIVIIGEMTLRKNWHLNHPSPSPSPDADALSSSSEEDIGRKAVSMSATVHELEDFKRKFVHTFVLTPRSRGSGGKKNLYVSNDVFRFLDLSSTLPPPTAQVGADVVDQEKTDIVAGAAVVAATDSVAVVDPPKDFEGTSTAATLGSTAASTDAASAGGSRSSGVTIASSTMDGPQLDSTADQDHATSTRKAMVSLEKDIISLQDDGALVASHVGDPAGAADAAMDEGLRFGGTAAGTGIGTAIGKSKQFLAAPGGQQQKPAYGMTSVAASSDDVLPGDPIGSTPPRQQQQPTGATFKVQPSVRSPVARQQQQQQKQHPPAGSWASMVARTTATNPWASTSPAPATTGTFPEPLPEAVEGDASKAVSGLDMVTGGSGTTIAKSDDPGESRNGERGHMVKKDTEVIQTVGRKQAERLEPFSSALSQQRHSLSKTSPGERGQSSSGGNTSSSVYIRNVPHNSTEELFLDMFANKYPNLKVTHIALYANRRFAFVDFSTKEAVTTLLQGANSRKVECPWSDGVYLVFERKNPDRHGTGNLGKDRVDRGGGGLKTPGGARDSWDTGSKGPGGGSASGHVRGGRYSRPKMQHGIRDRDEHVDEHIKRGPGGGGGGGAGRSGSRGRGERSSGGKDTRRPFPSRTERT